MVVLIVTPVIYGTAVVSGLEEHHTTSYFYNASTKTLESHTYYFYTPTQLGAASTIALFLVVFFYGIYPVIRPRKYYKDFESVVIEFEFIKKMIVGEIIFLTGYFGLVQADRIFSLQLGQLPVLSDFFPFLIFALILCISSGVSRMAFQIARRQFRFYFASACFSIMYRDEDYLKNMHYLVLGLSSYNKYINRYLGYRIGDKYLRMFISKFIRANIDEKRAIIGSISEAFKISDNKKFDYALPLRCLSTILKVPETDAFLDRESVGQKLKLIGPVLVAAIPIIISIIELIIQLKVRSQF